MTLLYNKHNKAQIILLQLAVSDGELQGQNDSIKKWFLLWMLGCPAGQFYHGIEYEVSDLRPGEVTEKPDATMYVKGQELNVTR